MTVNQLISNIETTNLVLGSIYFFIIILSLIIFGILLYKRKFKYAISTLILAVLSIFIISNIVSKSCRRDYETYKNLLVHILDKQNKIFMDIKYCGDRDVADILNSVDKTEVLNVNENKVTYKSGNITEKVQVSTIKNVERQYINHIVNSTKIDYYDGISYTHFVYQNVRPDCDTVCKALDNVTMENFEAAVNTIKVPNESFVYCMETNILYRII